MEMILLGNSNRTMSPTEANATSSRSHAVLQINVVQKNRTAGISEDHFAATLSIIDLAGSERASVTKNRGDRLLEGANINRSLLGSCLLTSLLKDFCFSCANEILALGNCINALCDPARKSHVPYRDSKLTRLLKFSLGGNCKTVMIVCVSPSSHHYDETHNTLKYANRAKNIKTKVSRNMINVNRHVSQYVKAIFDLTNEVAELKKRLQNSVKEAMDKINKSQAARDHVMKEGIRSIRAASDKTKDARKNKTKNMGNLRLMDRRMAVIHAWCTAYDGLSSGRVSMPSNLVKIRQIASNTLRDLAQQKKWLEDQLTLNHWHADVDKALKGSLQSLANLQDGAREQDIDILTREANLVKASGERDIMEELLTETQEVDLVEKLTQAHFNAILALQTLSTMNDEQIATEGSTAVLHIIQLCADATSQVIKPNGELVGTEKIYQPNTPGKKREKEKTQRIATPVKMMVTPVKVPVHAEQPEKSFEGSTPLSVRKRSDKVGTPKKATPRKPRVLVISKTPTNAKKRVRWDSNVHSNKKKDRDNKTECSTIASSHNDSFSLPSHSQTDASLNRPHVVEVHADDELDEPSFLNNTFSSSSAPSRRNSRMAIGFLSKKSEAGEETNSSTSSPENWSRAPPLRDVQLDAVINQPKYHHQRNHSNSKSSRLSSISNPISTAIHFENKAPQLTTISEPYQDTYSSSDSEQFSASRPPTTTVNIGGSLGRHGGPRISTAAQNQLKSALKKSITSANPTTTNERAMNSSNHVPSAATSSTAAARARRRSPPRSSPEGSSKSGNGARRNVRDKENGQSKALSPRSSGALMKANNRRLTITGAPGYSDQLLGHLQKEAEEDQIIPSISAALRDTSMITSGKPVWR